MARFFINDTGDYFETITDIAMRPDYIEVPLRPGPYDTWNGSAWVAVAPPVPVRWMVPWLTFLDLLPDATANAARTMVDGLNAKIGERIKRDGVPNDQAGVRTWLIAQGEDPDIILAME